MLVAQQPAAPEHPAVTHESHASAEQPSSQVRRRVESAVAREIINFPSIFPSIVFQGAFVAGAADASNSPLFLLEQLQWSQQRTGESGTAPSTENIAAEAGGVRRCAEPRGDSRTRSALGDLDFTELRGPHAGAQRELVVQEQRGVQQSAARFVAQQQRLLIAVANQVRAYIEDL